MLTILWPQTFQQLEPFYSTSGHRKIQPEAAVIFRVSLSSVDKKIITWDVPLYIQTGLRVSISVPVTHLNYSAWNHEPRGHCSKLLPFETL